ncbi:MAG TPA: hypothetical protein VFG62_13900, partial [Rhodopila sp.]|nr:hypothetical protein [Rhodopila sp.]
PGQSCAIRCSSPLPGAMGEEISGIMDRQVSPGVRASLWKVFEILSHDAGMAVIGPDPALCMPSLCGKS